MTWSTSEEAGWKTLKIDKSKGHGVAFKGQELHLPEIIAADHILLVNTPVSSYKSPDRGVGFVTSWQHEVMFTTILSGQMGADPSKGGVSISGTMVIISSCQNYALKNGKAPATSSRKKSF
jgi:hypothetical protein